MKSPLRSLVLLLLCPGAVLSHQTQASAQQVHRAKQDPNGPAPLKPAVTDTSQVTTTLEPLPLAESDRSVEVITPRDSPAFADSPVDLLRTDSSLNVQARAAEGVQANISIRGTTFEQSLILVNGLRVNDPETGHLNLDIPVPLDA